MSAFDTLLAELHYYYQSHSVKGALVILTDVLQLPVLKVARLLTDQAVARQKQVTSVSVIEVPVDKFIRPGEFALSTGMNVGKSTRLLNRFVKEIAQAGASALAIAIGPHTRRVPIKVAETANRLKLPLIELPWEVRFSDISEAILRQLISEASKTKSRDDFVWALTTGDISEEIAAVQGKQLGFETAKSIVGIVAKLSQSAINPSEGVQSNARFVEGLCVGMATRNHLQWIGTVMGDSVIGYLRVSGAKQRIKPLLVEVQSIAKSRCVISWGVGRTCNGFESFAKSYEDARISCDLGICTRGEGSITGVSDVLADRVLLNVQHDAHAVMLLNRYIVPLSRFQRVPLLATLEAFFDTDCNASKTARQLSISRQSLLYRLKKIETILNMDLHNPDNRFAIRFSLRLHKLRRHLKLQKQGQE